MREIDISSVRDGLGRLGDGLLLSRVKVQGGVDSGRGHACEKCAQVEGFTRRTVLLSSEDKRIFIGRKCAGQGDKSMVIHCLVDPLVELRV